MDKNQRRTLGTQIAAARKAAGFTQLQAATLLGFTKHSVSQFELGQDGGLQLLTAMMDLYGIQFSESIFVAKVDADVPRIIERKKS